MELVFCKLIMKFVFQKETVYSTISDGELESLVYSLKNKLQDTFTGKVWLLYTCLIVCVLLIAKTSDILYVPYVRLPVLLTHLYFPYVMTPVFN